MSSEVARSINLIEISQSINLICWSIHNSCLFLKYTKFPTSTQAFYNYPHSLENDDYVITYYSYKFTIFDRTESRNLTSCLDACLSMIH